MILVALYDRATEAFAPIMTVHTQNEAIRSLRHAVNSKETPVSTNPSDYELWKIADWNNQTGEIKEDKQLIARAEDHKE